MSYTYLDCESCTSSLGQEVASSAECFSDIPASVLLRLNLTAGKSCFKDSETASCQSSQSGMTLRRSTGQDGKDSLMWFAEGSPVRTYLPLEKERASVENAAGCGPSMQGSLAKFNPDLYGWKTRQCLLTGVLEWFLETFPRWGMMRGGELFPLPTPEHLICAREFGYSVSEWDTPSCADAHPRALNRTGPYFGGGQCHLQAQHYNKLHRSGQLQERAIQAAGQTDGGGES